MSEISGFFEKKLIFLYHFLKTLARIKISTKHRRF